MVIATALGGIGLGLTFALASQGDKNNEIEALKTQIAEMAAESMPDNSCDDDIKVCKVNGEIKYIDVAKSNAPEQPAP